MNKQQLLIGGSVVLLILIALGAYFLFATPKATGPKATTAVPQDGTYDIDGVSITLVGGTAETPAAPGSASKVTTKYFGNDATGDITEDGIDDQMFLLTQETGGSGTFYYIVARINTGAGYIPTNTILLGDRIAPQTTEIKDGSIVVNYATRKAGEPMTAQPSVAVSRHFSIIGGKLVESLSK